MALEWRPIPGRMGGTGGLGSPRGERSPHLPPSSVCVRWTAGPGAAGASQAAFAGRDGGCPGCARSGGGRLFPGGRRERRWPEKPAQQRLEEAELALVSVGGTEPRLGRERAGPATAPVIARPPRLTLHPGRRPGPATPPAIADHHHRTSWGGHSRWHALLHLCLLFIGRVEPLVSAIGPGKQDYKKNRPVLRATRLKAEAKKTALGIKEVALVLAALLVFLLAFYAFFYLNLSSEVDLDLDPNEN